MNELRLNQPVQDKYSNFLKDIVHKELIISKNLEMTQTVEIIFYENVNGNFGRPLLDVINEDETLTPQEKYQYSERYKTTEYTSRTINNMVNSQTGELVDMNNIPDGVTPIPEKDFWQTLPEALFQNEDGKISTRVYNAIKFSMTKMVERSRV